MKISRRVSKKVLAARLVEVRRRLHLSQAYIASFLGTPIPYVQSIESGKRRPPRYVMIELATLYGVLPQDLWGRHSFLEYNPQDATAAEELAHFKESIKTSIIGK